MDDVAAFQFKPYRLAHRDMDFIRGRERARWVLVLVAYPPPPLIAGDTHRKGYRSGRTRYRGDRHQRPHRQPEQHHRRQANTDVNPAHTPAFAADMQRVAVLGS